MAEVCPLLSASSADYDVALMFLHGEVSEFLQQLFILVKIRNVSKNMGHEVGYRGSSLSLVTIFSISFQLYTAFLKYF